MPVKRLNHAVLYVRDAEVTARFYSEALDFERLPMGFPGAVFMRVQDRPTTTTWACSRSAPRRSRRTPGATGSASTTWPGRWLPSTT